jgi:hypothetical protein
VGALGRAWVSGGRWSAKATRILFGE